MTKDWHRHGRLIITERENERQRTTRARAELYRVIARLRKDAETSTDPGTRTILEFAAEVISGLARTLQRHEERINADEESDRVL